jgi:hypothetical protein
MMRSALFKCDVGHWHAIVIGRPANRGPASRDQRVSVGLARDAKSNRSSGNSSQSRVRFRPGRLWKPERRGACLLPGKPTILFLPANPRVSLLVFLLVSAAISEENYRKFNWLWH